VGPLPHETENELYYIRMHLEYRALPKGDDSDSKEPLSTLRTCHGKSDVCKGEHEEKDDALV